MQLEALQIFCDVVRWASFSRGAAENGISQSSASQAVHQLELRLGVKLIDRSKRPLVLTPHGQIFYDGCKELIARYQELEARVKALENDENVVGVVRVGSIYSVGLAHMTRFADQFRRLYPHADVRLEYLHPTRVIESVQDGLNELGLISFPRKWADLTVIPWRDEEMVIAANPRHPIVGSDAVGVERLEGVSFVAFESSLTIRRAIDRFLRKHGVQVDLTLEFDNIETIKRAIVELPDAVAILPVPTLEHELKAGTISAIRFRDHRLVRPIAIIHRAAGGLGLTAARFLDLLLQSAPGPAGLLSKSLATVPAS
jgi:DNA-binding transcriptional LysR family regulator